MMKIMTALLSFVFVYNVICMNPIFGQQEEPFVYNDRSRRDPFLPLVDEDGRYLSESELPYYSGELKLTGILWDSQGDSSCLINNQIAKVGDSISGFVVENITKDSVTISKEGRNYIMRLSAEQKQTEE
jgi:hypothetical protein